MRFWCTLGLCAITAVSAVAAGEPRPVPATLPNLVLVLIDTERADHISAAGHRRGTSPVFDALARRGHLFTNAYAPAPWTRPSVASLFTGRYPQRHGVQMRHDKLPETIPTLAERLRQRGLHTVCVTTNPHVTEAWGMTRGFDRVVEIMPNRHKLKAGNDARLVSRRLDSIIPRLESPFFLYVHLIDPHYPYEPPPFDLRALGIGTRTSEERLLYQGEIHFADRYVGHMLGSLADAGHLDHSILVMTSDHGEELWDHGLLGHGKTLYEEVVRVPLAIALSGDIERKVLGARRAARQVDANVSLVDLMPTLLRLVDLPLPPDVDGIDLTPALTGETIEPRPLFFSVEKERVSLGAVVFERAKLVIERATGEGHLHFLDEDPEERGRGIPAGRETTALHLASLLEAFERSARPGMHLELAGRLHERDRRNMVVRLQTDGRFVQVEKHGFERGDRLWLSRDESSMRVDVVLRSFWHESPLHIWVQDRDELTFEVEPSDAEVQITVRLNGERPSPAVVRFPPAGAQRWPLRFSRAELEAERMVDRRLGGVYLYAQVLQDVEKVEAISSDLSAALEALGYLH